MKLLTAVTAAIIYTHTLFTRLICCVQLQGQKKKRGGDRQTLYNSQGNNEVSPSLPYLSLALKPSANWECEQNGTACLLYCCEQTRQRFSPPIHFNLPFLAINPGHTPRSVSTPPPTAHPADPPQNPSDAATEVLCLLLPPPRFFACPLALTWTTLVGGDGGMPRQEHQSRGKGGDEWMKEGRSRRSAVDGGFKEKKKVSHSFIFLSLFLLSFTFLYFFSCPFRITWLGLLSGVCGEGEADYTLDPPTPVQFKLKEEKSSAENYFWLTPGSQFYTRK